MSDPERQLKEALRTLAAEAEAGDHPAPELLASGSDEIKAHLALCAECTELAAELGRFGASVSGSPAEEAQAAELWARLQPQVVPGGPPAVSSATILPMRRRFEPPRWALASLAAALAGVALGLSFWASSLERRLAELSSPEVNVPIFDLTGGSTARGSGARGSGARDSGARASAPVARQRVVIPASSRFYTLILPAPGASEGERYRAEISRADGSLVWRGDRLVPNPWGSFTLMLPSGTLADGDFELELSALEPAGPRVIEAYALTVARSGDGVPTP